MYSFTSLVALSTLALHSLAFARLDTDNRIPLSPSKPELFDHEFEDQSSTSAASEVKSYESDARIPCTEVDIVIIGAGSSGMYSATRLTQMNKTVAVVEPRDKVGGHVDTFYDVVSNTTFDVGVIVYHNISLMTEFAAYVGVPLKAVPLSAGGETIVMDFKTAARLEDTAPNSTALAAGFQQYAEIVDQFPYLLSGFHLPSPVPETLLMSWGRFLTKYNLSAIATTVDQYAQGFGDILKMPALYVMKYFGQLLLEDFATGIELTTAAGDNQALFDAAADKVGRRNIFLNSHVVHVKRFRSGVEVYVKTPSGVRLIRAKKMLITAPPELKTLEEFLPLRHHEKAIFGKLKSEFYWDAVIRNSGLPTDVSIQNYAPHNPFGAISTGIYGFSKTGVPNLHTAYFGSATHISDADVGADMLATVKKISKTLGYNSSEAEIAFLRSHSPYELTVSADDIKAGFYDKLNALQGYKSTWYTGGTFQAHDSGSIWLFTEKEILPALAA